MLNYVVFIAAHLKWALNYLLYHSSSKPYYQLDISAEAIEEEELSINRYKKSKEEEEVECAVCLSKIEEGEEIRELRCDHLFHRECLDRWHGYNITCPLCRGSLAPRRAVGELGEEVLFFKFCSFSTSDDRDRWWVR